MTTFLEDYDDRLPWARKHGDIEATEVLRGSDGTDLSVVHATAKQQPVKSDLQWMWKERAGRSADPVLVVVTYPSSDGTSAAILGPDADAVPVSGIELALAERLAARALEIDSPVGLTAELRRRLSSLRGGVAPGFRNEGLFASHVLSQQPQRANWGELCTKSDPLLGDRGERLLTGLGYKVETVPDGIVLRAGDGGQRRAAAVLLLDEESFDNPLGRFAGSNAVTHGLALARREGVPWLILLGGSVARLFPADPDVGVGRKGQTQTYVEVDLDLLTGDTAGYLSLLFAPDALVKGGIVEQLLADSTQYATALSDRLRDRIYDDVIPALATAVASRSKVWEVPAEDQKAVLDEAYHQAMIILFRMLFVAYAEDRGLLPLGVNDAYTANALNTLAQRILDEPDKGFSETSTSLWGDLTQIWEVIDTGDLEGMGVPAYNGGLFTQDRKKNPSGAATYKLRLTNSEIGPVIRGLMIDITPDGYPGLVDFRSLDVREFGTIYEGLLESGLAIAETDLTVDKNDTFIPAKKGDEVIVEAGSVYFHSRSGSRKATGSYFTKPFAVQHLLDQALEPALDAHLERIKSLLDKGANKTAAEQLFDFRVADLSMGSAHFLVAAVDRIEARFSAFIADNPMPEVQDELHKLRTTAATQLGLTPEDAGIDDGLLRRRQIARRCIYGIDLNEIAVELARLAIWIHTFVPGLPLSFLNHGLIHGNSLTGVGTITEITEAINAAQECELGDKQGLMIDINQPLEELLSRADTQLTRLAELSGASISEVTQVQDLYNEISEALEPLTALCDLITAERTTRKLKKTDSEKFLLLGGEKNNLTNALTADELEKAVLTHPQLKKARLVAKQVQAVHLPTAFPEVFRREPSGFDCILGNPPWEKMHINSEVWWVNRYPGLRSLKPNERQSRLKGLPSERPDLVAELNNETEAIRLANELLVAGPFRGIGAAHIDLFAAFSWRAWQEVRVNGRIGIVLPRTALYGSGTIEWRKDVFDFGTFEEVVTLVNSKQWVFPGIHPQYTVGLVSISKNPKESVVLLKGPFHSEEEFRSGVEEPGLVVEKSQIRSWVPSAPIPLLTRSSGDTVLTIGDHPKLRNSRFSFRPMQGDFNETNDKSWLTFGEGSSNEDPVWSGRAFNLWAPEGDEVYAYADRDEVLAELFARRRRASSNRKSAYYGMPREWIEDPVTMGPRAPRIAFRDVCRATDSRTMICALVPPNIFLTTKAPWLLRQSGGAQDEAYLLAVLSSIPFDWFTRRFVELKMSFELLNSFPVPVIDSVSGRSLTSEETPRSTGPDLRPVRDALIHTSGRLAAVDLRYESWAKEVGVPIGSIKTVDKRDALITEADALVSHLYGLSREQVEQLFATFHRGWDYKPRLEAVLEHYDRWAASLGEGA